MTQPTATTRPRTILYVADHEATASDGADRLENAELDAGPGRSVRPATTVERVENWAAAVDCVVFAETPTTAAGSNLLDVVEACGSTPVVLFSDGSFTPAAARSTDGIDGYVRSDTDDAIVHLADEIEWVCRDSSRIDTDAETSDDTDRDRLRTLVAAIPDPAVWYELEDGEPIVRAATGAVAAVFDIEPTDIVGEPVDEWLVPSGLEHRRTTLRETLQAGERRQFERRHDTDDGIRDFLVTLEPLESAASNARAESTQADHDPGGLLIYHDVTELHRCRRARADADARLEAITDLLDDVWPSLNVARGYLKHAADTSESERITTAVDAQERVEEGLERLAAVAKRDGTLVDTEPVGVHDIARQAWISVDTGDTRLVTRDATDRILEANKARLRELFEHLVRLVVSDETVPAVVVGVTDDGFCLTQYDPEADTDAVDALEAEPVASRAVSPDGTDIEIDAVECIADAHGWTIDVVETDGRIAVVCRGVVGERALNGV